MSTGRKKCFTFPGKVWLTIDAKCYTGEKNEYSDWSVAKPIIGWSLVGLSGAGAAISLIPSVATGVAAVVGAGVRTGLLAGIGTTGTVLHCHMALKPGAL